jgi:hypothetical protein
MSFPSPQGPLNQLANAAAILVVIAFMLWLAVWLIQQIWVWLLILSGIALLLAGTISWIRWRRNRW